MPFKSYEKSSFEIKGVAAGELSFFIQQTKTQNFQKLRTFMEYK